MYTASALKEQRVKDLGKLATKWGITGWRSMRKDELVKALVRAARSKARKTASAKSRVGKKKSSPTGSARKPKPAARRKTKAAKAKSPRTSRRIQRANAERARSKNLATPNGRRRASSSKNGRRATGAARKDRITLLVRDAYWLQAIWELSRENIDRAQAAMAEQWHTAVPTLRLIEVESGATTSTAERVAREIQIHGGVKTWYIDVQDSPKSYRVDIGYLASNGKFYTLARSNAVTTPRPGSSDSMGEEWSEIAENCEKIYALSGGYTDENTNGDLQQLFEEQLGRAMGSPVARRFGVGADRMLGKRGEFDFTLDAEMIIHGTTRPNAHVTLAGTPVKLRPDGSFSARMAMPDRRQVLPVVASSADGVEQRTIVLAIERNTKVMEPMVRETAE